MTSTPISIDDVFEGSTMSTANKSSSMTDTSVILNDALDNVKRVLFEGAQGVMIGY